MDNVLNFDKDLTANASAFENLEKTVFHHGEILRESKYNEKFLRQTENDQYLVTYYYSQAFHALIINIGHLFFGPFILPLLFLIYGRPLMHSMLFQWRLIYFLGDFTNWLWFAGTAVMIYVHPELNEQLAVMYIGTGSVIFLRQVLVSLKYGFYTKKMWHLISTVKVEDEIIFNNLILRAWVKVPVEVAEHEMTSSIKKLKIPLKKLNLKFNQLPEVCIRVQVSEEIAVDTENRISLLKVALFIIKQVTETQKTFELNIIEICGYLYIGSYIALRYYSYGVNGFRYDPVEIIYTLKSLFKGYISSTQFVKFIAAGLYDFKRKRLLMAQCTSLICTTDRKYSVLQNSNKHMLDTSDAETMLSWYCLRRSFLDFGRRYTLRVFLYASLLLPICIAIIVILFLQILGLVGVSYNYYIVPGIFLSVEVFILMIQMSLSALSLNNYYSIHKDIILEKSSFYRNYSENEDVIKCLDYLTQRLSHDQAIRPIKIMGVTINNSFLIQLGALAISGLYAIINLLASN